MWHSMTADQVGYRLAWLAMLIRVAALFYALGVLNFYPHPAIAAKAGWLIQLWVVTAAYTILLLVMLFLPINHWLRSEPFLVLDTAFVLIIINLAGGGYRNIFSLYSLIPSVTTALSLPSAEKPFRRAFLLIGVVTISSVGFVVSLFLDGYTLPVIIAQRQIDEVVLRTASYWVTGGLLAALAAMMIAWQYSQNRTNALREQAAVEEERRRIATDIHDGVLSQLSALSRRAEYASLLLGEDVPGTQEELQRVITMAAEVHEGIRWIVRALRQDPAQLTLAGELTRIAERFRRNIGMQVDLELPAAEAYVPVDAIRHMGYIVNEALTNVWKHSGTDRASIFVWYRDDELGVQVQDEGKGFSTLEQVTHPTPGLGLQTMRERAQELGAQIETVSVVGSGTRITVRLPLPARRGGAT